MLVLSFFRFIYVVVVNIHKPDLVCVPCIYIYKLATLYRPFIQCLNTTHHDPESGRYPIRLNSVLCDVDKHGNFKICSDAVSSDFIVLFCLQKKTIKAK